MHGRSGGRLWRAVLACMIVAGGTIPSESLAQPAVPADETQPAVPADETQPAPSETSTAETTETTQASTETIPPTTATVEAAAPTEQALAIEKRVDTTEAAPGEPFTYTLAFQCSRSPSCTGMQIVDVLPPSVRFVATRGWPAQLSPDGRTVVFTIGDRQPGFEGQARIIVEFPPGTPVGTEAVNQADLSATDAPPVRSNPVTVRSVGRSDWDLVKRPAPGSSVAQLDTPYTYRVSFVVNAGSTQPLDGVSFVDRLPAGVTFVSASQGGTYDVGTNTVRWNIGTITPSATRNVVVNRDVTVIFPSSTFAVNQQVTNEVDCNGTPRGGTPATLDQASSTVRIRPAGLVGAVRKRGTTSTLGPGKSDVYTIVLSNPNETTITGLVAEDQLPPQLAVVSDGQPNLTGTRAPDAVRWRPIGGAFQPLAVQNQAGGWAATLPANTDAFRVEYASADPGDSSTITLRAGVPASGIGRDGVTIPNGASFSNCATATAAGAAVSRRSCFDQQLASLLVSFSKTLASAADPAPGSTVSWLLDLDVAADSPRGLASPAFSDCLPPGVDLVDPANPANPLNAQLPAGFPSPTVTRTPGGCGSGQVLVQWRFDGFTLAPGGTGTLLLNTTIAGGALPGTTLTNRAELSSTDLPEPLTGSDEVTVADDALVVGLKEVKGDRDAGFVAFPALAQASPGGSATYRVTITNRGTIPVTSLSMVDILPAPGDTGVVTGTPRGSQWTPVYDAHGSAPPQATLTGSTSRNPCRFGVTSGCDAPGWFPLPTAVPSTVGSLQADFGSFVLAPGQSLVFQWDVRVPADVADGAIAWNSFGFESQRADTGEQLLPTEPNPVGLRVTRPNRAQSNPGVDIRKLVNGVHAPDPPGPFIPVGDPVVFTYVVTNTGDVPLEDITVDDDVLGPITCPQTTLQPGEEMVCTAPADVAQEGVQTNIGIVTATPQIAGPAPEPIIDLDIGTYTGEQRSRSSISLRKTVNGVHAPTAPGPQIAAGTRVAFEFFVVNSGALRLDGIRLVDDSVTVTCPRASLQPRDSMVCTAQQVAVKGQHENTATVTARPPTGSPVSDSDRGHYTNTSGTDVSPDDPADSSQEQLPPTGLGSLGPLALGGVLVGTGIVLTLVSGGSARRRAAHGAVR